MPVFKDGLHTRKRVALKKALRQQKIWWLEWLQSERENLVAYRRFSYWTDKLGEGL